MKALHVILVAGLLLAVQAYPQPTAGGRFEAVDIFIGSGDAPLAAYQFELAAEVGQITIVGIEGGDHAAFKEAPYYDPAALNRQNRIIIAAFSTAKDLPKGVTRVARVHVHVAGDTEPQYVVALKVAASDDGTRIPATATVSRVSRGETQ